MLDRARKQHRTSEHPVIVATEGPRRLRVIHTVHQHDGTKNHATQERFLRDPNAVSSGPMVCGSSVAEKPGVYPEPSSEMRPTRAILNVLSGAEDRRCPRLPNGKNRFFSHG